MPQWILAAIVGGLAKGALEGALRVLAGIGFGFIAYQGIDTLFGSAIDHVFSNLNSLPGEVSCYLGLLKIDRALNVVVSAFMVRLVLNGVINGALTRMQLREVRT